MDLSNKEPLPYSMDECNPSSARPGLHLITKMKRIHALQPISNDLHSKKVGGQLHGTVIYDSSAKPGLQSQKWNEPLSQQMRSWIGFHLQGRMGDDAPTIFSCRVRQRSRILVMKAPSFKFKRLDLIDVSAALIDEFSPSCPQSRFQFTEMVILRSRLPCM